jgi:hypothetical protein
MEAVDPGYEGVGMLVLSCSMLLVASMMRVAGADDVIGVMAVAAVSLKTPVPIMYDSESERTPFKIPSMLHLYDSCPYSPTSQATRLKPARALSDAGITCVVWGEDALAFKFFVPTELFALHLIVADNDLQSAATTVQNSLPYQKFTGIDKHYCESIWLDPSQPKPSLSLFGLNLQLPRTNAQ